MTSLAAFHDAFAAAIVEQRPNALARFLDDPRKVDDAVVYRNNVFRGGVDALATTYQSVERLAGRAFFERAAAAFVAASPPRRRTLVGYGEAFPEFLARMPEIETAPYLPDAARLDRAWLAAHLAADALSLEPHELSDLPDDELADLRPGLHPSVRITTLGWDIYAVWAANRGEGDVARNPRQVVQRQSCAIHWRLDNEVRHGALSEGPARFFQMLSDGASLGEASEAASSAAPDFQTHLVSTAARRANRLRPVCLLAARLLIARAFILSGLTKWDGLRIRDDTFYLFGNEYFGKYALPAAATDAFAVAASFAEIVLPILLIAGFAARCAAAGLLIMTTVIQIFVYPEAWWTVHVWWTAVLLAILAFGPGALSVDRLTGLESPSESGAEDTSSSRQ